MLREAMAGLLPEKVRLRRRESSLHPLALRGLMEREKEAAKAILQREDATWQLFVRREWLERRWADEAGGSGALVIWLCVCWELWKRRLQEGLLGPAGVANSAEVEYS